MKRVVLGAWGCGAHGNPLGEIATTWRKVLLSGTQRTGKTKGKRETWDGIEEVVFAINNFGMAEAFDKAFGDALIFEQTSEEGEDDQSDEAQNPEAVQVKQLQDKIQELEIRIHQTMNSQVKSGLNSVISGLKNQLLRTTKAGKDCEVDKDEAKVCNE